MCRSKIFFIFSCCNNIGSIFSFFGTSLVAQLVKKKKKIHLQCERPGSILGLGRSPGTRKGYPLQYSGLENSMGSIVAKSWTWLSDFHFHCCYNSEAVTGNLCASVSYGTWLSFWWSVQFSRSVVSDSLRPHESQHTRPPCPSPTPGLYSNSRPLSQWCHPAISSSAVLFSSCPRSFPICMRWPKYWCFSFSICPSIEHSGLISFGMDWLDLLAVQGTLKSLLQHHSSKASIIQHSAFFTVQLSHPCMATGKTIALTRWIFVGKKKGLCF